MEVVVEATTADRRPRIKAEINVVRLPFPEAAAVVLRAPLSGTKIREAVPGVVSKNTRDARMWTEIASPGQSEVRRRQIEGTRPVEDSPAAVEKVRSNDEMGREIIRRGEAHNRWRTNLNRKVQRRPDTMTAKGVHPDPKDQRRLFPLNQRNGNNPTLPSHPSEGLTTPPRLVPRDHENPRSPVPHLSREKELIVDLLREEEVRVVKGNGKRKRTGRQGKENAGKQ